MTNPTTPRRRVPSAAALLGLIASLLTGPTAMADEFRFKDENALWLSAEYRWRPRPFLSAAVFADAGETRANWEDVDLTDMRTGYGFGVGFHSDSETILRLDVGTGAGEGWQVFLKMQPAF